MTTDKNSNPCRTCQKRSASCHATCKAYGAWRRSYTAARAERYSKIKVYIGLNEERTKKILKAYSKRKNNRKGVN